MATFLAETCKKGAHDQVDMFYGALSKLCKITCKHDDEIPRSSGLDCKTSQIFVPSRRYKDCTKVCTVLADCQDEPSSGDLKDSTLP